MADLKTWARGHAATIAVIGGIAIIGTSGTAVAVVSSQQNLSTPSSATSESNPEVTPTGTPSPTPNQAADVDSDLPTNESDSGTESGSPGNGGNTPSEPAPSEPAPEPEPEPVPEPEPASPDAPYPSLSSDGSTLTVSWGTPNMNGATLAYYWVDITNSSYTTGDRQTPVYGNSITVGNLNHTCAVIGVVTTEGIQSTSGVHCI